MVVTIKLLRDHRLLLLLPLTRWLGVEKVFRAADYPPVRYITHLLAVCIYFVWGDKHKSNVVCAFEKYLSSVFRI